MATWYIHTAGSDTTGDGSYANPYATITKCQTVGTTGDTIIVKTSVAEYDMEGVVFTKSFTIQGETSANPPIFNGNGTYTYWLANNAAGCTLTISDLVFRNFNLTGNYNFIFYLLADNSTFNFTRCTFKDIILNSPAYGQGIIGAEDEAVQTYNITLTNCTVHSLSAIGVAASQNLIQLYVNSTYVNSLITITGCTFVFNAAGGNVAKVINCNALYPNVVPVSIKNTIMYCVGSAVSTRETTYSCLFGMTGATTGTGVITSDPLFVDEANFDFRLRPSSPCLDTGTLT